MSYLQTDYSASSAAGRIEPDEDGNCVIVVNNFSGTELPMTGGPGVELLEAIGGITMAAAFAVLVIRKRRTAY